MVLLTTLRAVPEAVSESEVPVAVINVTPCNDETPVAINVAIWRLPVPVAFANVNPWTDVPPVVTLSAVPDPVSTKDEPVAVVNVVPARAETPETFKLPVLTIEPACKLPLPVASVNVTLCKEDVPLTVRFPPIDVLFETLSAVPEPVSASDVPVAVVKVRFCRDVPPVVTCSDVPEPLNVPETVESAPPEVTSKLVQSIAAVVPCMALPPIESVPLIVVVASEATPVPEILSVLPVRSEEVAFTISPLIVPVTASEDPLIAPALIAPDTFKEAPLIAPPVVTVNADPPTVSEAPVTSRPCVASTFFPSVIRFPSNLAIDVVDVLYSMKLVEPVAMVTTKFESIAESLSVNKISRELVVVMVFPRLYASCRDEAPAPPPRET